MDSQEKSEQVSIQISMQIVRSSQSSFSPPGSEFQCQRLQLEESENISVRKSLYSPSVLSSCSKYFFPRILILSSWWVLGCSMVRISKGQWWPHMINVGPLLLKQINCGFHVIQCCTVTGPCSVTSCLPIQVLATENCLTCGKAEKGVGCYWFRLPDKAA